MPALAALCCASARADAPAPLLVVLDAGHGGSNLGAPGRVDGVYEKKFTLAMARLVRKRLESDGVSVITTRDSDVYITLAERVRRANSTGANLFVSLHANAAPEHNRRGWGTFVLSREVRDIEAHDAGTRGADPVGAMIERARVRHIARDSARLSSSLRSRLGAARVDDRGARQAPFDVLEGLKMPATLVEVGYIDHAEEGVELLQPEVMHQLAGAIAAGIEDFARAP